MDDTTVPTGRLRHIRRRSGDVLKDRYVIIERLNAGSMSCVYKAWDNRMSRFVVVKIADGSQDGEHDVERLRREGVILATLRHPRIPRAFDAGDDGTDGYWIALDLLEGRSLERRLTFERILPIREAVQIAAETCEALEAAHAVGIVHRDVKPGNLMLTPDGAALIDFGIAAYVPFRRARRLTLPGIAVGTPTYMSPEQCRGDDDLDGRSDLYALGLTLYRMLSGRRALGSNDGLETLQAQLFSPPMPFALTAPGLRLPKRLEDAVMRALKKDPHDRFRTASEMREEVLAAAS
jgi:serine/threonine protein kinase